MANTVGEKQTFLILSIKFYSAQRDLYLVTKPLLKFEYTETGFHDDGESKRTNGIVINHGLIVLKANYFLS